METTLDRTYFTALMWAQLAIPVFGPFCSLVLPCTVSNWSTQMRNVHTRSIANIFCWHHSSCISSHQQFSDMKCSRQICLNLNAKNLSQSYCVRVWFVLSLTWHPAFSSIFAYRIVFSTSENTRIFAVMGTFSFSWQRLTAKQGPHLSLKTIQQEGPNKTFCFRELPVRPLHWSGQWTLHELKS